jgi:hypothetical protein
MFFDNSGIPWKALPPVEFTNRPKGTGDRDWIAASATDTGARRSRSFNNDNGQRLLQNVVAAEPVYLSSVSAALLQKQPWCSQIESTVMSSSTRTD